MCMLTLFAAVVSALWGMSSAGGPWRACWVCGSGVIMVSPGSWVLVSDRRNPSIHVPHPNRKPGAEHRNEWSRREREGEKNTWTHWKCERDMSEALECCTDLWSACFSSPLLSTSTELRQNAANRQLRAHIYFHPSLAYACSKHYKPNSLITA